MTHTPNGPLKTENNSTILGKRSFPADHSTEENSTARSMNNNVSSASLSVNSGADGQIHSLRTAWKLHQMDSSESIFNSVTIDHDDLHEDISVDIGYMDDMLTFPEPFTNMDKLEPHSSTTWPFVTNPAPSVNSSNQATSTAANDPNIRTMMAPNMSRPHNDGTGAQMQQQFFPMQQSNSRQMMASHPGSYPRGYYRVQNFMPQQIPQNMPPPPPGFVYVPKAQFVASKQTNVNLSAIPMSSREMANFQYYYSMPSNNPVNTFSPATMMMPQTASCQPCEPQQHLQRNHVVGRFPMNSPNIVSIQAFPESQGHNINSGPNTVPFMGNNFNPPANSDYSYSVGSNSLGSMNSGHMQQVQRQINKEDIMTIEQS